VSVQNDVILTVKHVVMMNLLTYVYTSRRRLLKRAMNYEHLSAETETGFTEAVFVVCATELLVFEYMLRVRNLAPLRQYSLA